MPEPRFIGAIDLSVRLSSMNPLRYHKLDAAYLTLQKEVLSSCLYTYKNSVHRDLIDRIGIIYSSGSDKRFWFSDIGDLITFVRMLRWKLIEQRLPFKICVRIEEGGIVSLMDQWGPKLSTLSTDDDTRSLAVQQLGTDSVDDIKKLFVLYTANASDEGNSRLNGDLESFKGLGFYVAEGSISLDEIALQKFFLNHFPQKSTAGYVPIPYKDLVWDFSRQDLVSHLNIGRQSIENSENVISGILDLMRRSMKTDTQNGAFYVSALNGVAMSSNFSRLGRLTADRALDFEQSDDDSDAANLDDLYLLAGWQGYPPIFEAAILDKARISMLKRAPGIEILIGTILSKVFEGQEVEQHSDLSRDEIFQLLVRQIQKSYGEAIVRKVISLPDTVITEVHRRVILDAASSQ